MATNKMKAMIGDEDNGLGADGLPSEDAVTKKEAKQEEFKFVVEGEEEDVATQQKATSASKDELDEYKESKDDEYTKLKKELEEERLYRQRLQEEQEEAYRFAQQAHEENKRLKNVLDQGSTLYADTVKSKLDTELASAQKAFKEAYESGDSEGMTAAQIKIAEVIAERKEFSRVPPLQRAEDAVNMQPIQQQPASSPASPRVDVKAEAWYERNKSWFGKDDEMTAVTYAVDKKLIREGVDPRTDEYYRRLDERLRQVFPDRFEDTQESSSKTSVRQQSTVVAPASRSASPKTVKIPPGGAAVARKLGIPLEEYAKQWAAVNGRSQ